MDLPPELIIDHMLKLPIEDILTYCQTNRQINQICQTDYLWSQLIQRDYPQVEYELGNRTSKEVYFMIRPINVYFNKLRISSRMFDIEDLPRFIAYLMQSDNIAFYVNANKEIVGLQTLAGVDPQLNLNDVSNVFIYNIMFDNLAPIKSTILIFPVYLGGHVSRERYINTLNSFKQRGFFDQSE